MAIVRSHRFQLALGTMECWECHRPSLVAALVAPGGSVATEEEFGEVETVEAYEPILLTDVVRLSHGLEDAVRAACPLFRLDVSLTLETTYWMNHCEHCPAKFGQHYVHDKPDGPFFAWPKGDYETQRMVALPAGEIECGMPYIVPPEPLRRKKKTSG